MDQQTAFWVAIITTGVAAVGAVFLQAWQMYLSYKRDTLAKKSIDNATRKIEDNTVLTIAGTRAATVNAASAASAATTAAEKVDTIVEKLNGSLDDKITALVMDHFGPLEKAVKDHAALDEKSMVEIRDALQELTIKIKPLVEP